MHLSLQYILIQPAGNHPVPSSAGIISIQQRHSQTSSLLAPPFPSFLIAMCHPPHFPHLPAAGHLPTTSCGLEALPRALV